MPSRTEATRAKAALCATGRLTPLRLFSTPPVSSPGKLGQRARGRLINSDQPSYRIVPISQEVDGMKHLCMALLVLPSLLSFSQRNLRLLPIHRSTLPHFIDGSTAGTLAW